MEAITLPINVFYRDLRIGKPTEICAVLLALLYLVCFAIGIYGKRNKRHNILLKRLKPLLLRNYAIAEEIPGDGLNELALYATGRRSCRSCTLTIKLKQNHDFVHVFLLDPLLLKSEHRLLVQIDFAPEDKIAPFVYSLIHASIQDMFLAVSPDIKAFTKSMPLGYLPAGVTCWTENRECLLLPARFVTALQQASVLFRYLHVSDQIDLIEIDPPDRGIRLCLRLPRTLDEFERAEELISATFELADVIVQKGEDDLTVFPTQEARSEALNARTRARVSLSREINVVERVNMTAEALQAKKDD